VPQLHPGERVAVARQPAAEHLASVLDLYCGGWQGERQLALGPGHEALRQRMALRRLLRPSRRCSTHGEQVVLRAALQRKRARLSAGLLGGGLAAPSSAAAAHSGRLRREEIHQETDAHRGGGGGRRERGWRRHVRSGPRPSCGLRLVERGRQRVIIQAVAEIGALRAADIAAGAATAVNAASRVAATTVIPTAVAAVVAARQITVVAQGGRRQPTDGEILLSCARRLCRLIIFRVAYHHSPPHGRLVRMRCPR